MHLQSSPVPSAGKYQPVPIVPKHVIISCLKRLKLCQTRVPRVHHACKNVPLVQSAGKHTAWSKLACVAIVSVGLASKERPRNGIFPARNRGESQNMKEGVGERKLLLPPLFSRANSLLLNPTETLATQARSKLVM